MTNPSIIFDHVDKTYTISNAGQYLSFRDSLAHFASLKRPERRIVEALRDVSFTIPRGQIAALIGKNGAGKSTTLKLVSGITKPTRGHVTIQGRVATLMELGAGFHYELTGRENIAFFGAVLGMTREEVASRTASIIEFSELGDFIDVPLKKYSSGMQLRLGFSVATHVDPEILLLDEVLAVGDDRFRKKCLNKMTSILERGITVLLVSHDEATVRAVAERVLLIHKGQLVFDGPTDRGFDEYSRLD
ncbi:MAG: ABC transporter ATP-binding protein [Planctomycetota bacterium]